VSTHRISPGSQMVRAGRRVCGTAHFEVVLCCKSVPLALATLEHRQQASVSADPSRSISDSFFTDCTSQVFCCFRIVLLHVVGPLLRGTTKSPLIVYSRPHRCGRSVTRRVPVEVVRLWHAPISWLLLSIYLQSATRCTKCCGSVEKL
jgi:hypothetical protein